jgi:hypothetical protein
VLTTFRPLTSWAFRQTVTGTEERDATENLAFAEESLELVNCWEKRDMGKSGKENISVGDPLTSMERWKQGYKSCRQSTDYAKSLLDIRLPTREHFHQSAITTCACLIL